MKNNYLGLVFKNQDNIMHIAQCTYNILYSDQSGGGGSYCF